MENKLKNLLILIPLLAMLAGCEENYRYPCQDPENWNQKTCQKPFCSANGTCPEDLTHYEKGNANPAPTKNTINSGGCK